MSGQEKVQKQHDALYANVKQFFLDSTSGQLTAASVTTLIRYTMEVVQTTQRWKTMKGSDKKDLVLGVVTAVVEDLIEDPQVVGDNLDENSKEAILAALAFAPMIIDAAVGFAKTYSDNKPSSGRRRLCCF